MKATTVLMTVVGLATAAYASPGLEKRIDKTNCKYKNGNLNQKNVCNFAVRCPGGSECKCPGLAVSTVPFEFLSYTRGLIAFCFFANAFV